MVLGVGKGVLFREVSTFGRVLVSEVCSVQGCPHFAGVLIKMHSWMACYSVNVFLRSLRRGRVQGGSG